MAAWIWRRRNYLINKEFQFRYMARIIFGMVVMALIIAFTVYYTTWARIMDEFYNIPRIASQFAPLFSSVNGTMLFILFFFLILAAVLSIFISHSIAGPIYRFEKSLQAIAQGDLTLRVGLRKTDEFKHVANTLNEMVVELRKSLNVDCELIEELMRLTQGIQTASTREGAKLPTTVSKDLEKLNQTLVHLQNNLGQFKLKG